MDSIPYEMPLGYAGESVLVRRHVLDSSVWCLHEGKLMQLHPVDLAANARSKRTKRNPRPKKSSNFPSKSAADLRFERDFKPVVDKDGGYDG